MSTFLECIVDICLPIAARWIVIQIFSIFGTDLNENTMLWFGTIILCSIVSEKFTFHPKKKSSGHKRHEKPLEEPSDESGDEDLSVSQELELTYGNPDFNPEFD